MVDTKPVPTSVYRYYDAMNSLIYVGITSRGIRRNKEHNNRATWWRYVVRQEVDHYPDRAEAERVEQELIERHLPPFNDRHNPHHEALSADYLSWAETMLADHSARQANRCAFEKRWRQLGRTSADLPADWTEVVDRLIVAGLPLAELLEVATEARAARIDRPGSAFRFMSGVAWKRIAKSREAADGAMPPPLVGIDDEDEDAPLSPAQALISATALALGSEESRVAAEACARAYAEDSGRPLDSEWDMELAIAADLIETYDYMFFRMDQAFRQLLYVLPIADGDRLCDEMNQNHASWVKDGSSDTRGRSYALAFGLNRLGEMLAGQYLDSLPEGERDKWVSAAEEWRKSHRPPHFPGEVAAVRIAQLRNEPQRRVPEGMCGFGGEDLCGSRAEYRAWFKGCTCSGSSCGGHDRACVAHLSDLAQREELERHIRLPEPEEDPWSRPPF